MGVSGRAEVDLVGRTGRLLGNLGWKGVILRRNFLFLWVGALDPWMTAMESWGSFSTTVPVSAHLPGYRGVGLVLHQNCVSHTEGGKGVGSNCQPFFQFGRCSFGEGCPEGSGGSDLLLHVGPEH